MNVGGSTLALSDTPISPPHVFIPLLQIPLLVLLSLGIHQSQSPWHPASRQSPDSTTSWCPTALSFLLQWLQPAHDPRLYPLRLLPSTVHRLTGGCILSGLRFWRRLPSCLNQVDLRAERISTWLLAHNVIYCDHCNLTWRSVRAKIKEIFTDWF